MRHGPKGALEAGQNTPVEKIACIRIKGDREDKHMSLPGDLILLERMTPRQATKKCVFTKKCLLEAEAACASSATNRHDTP